MRKVGFIVLLIALFHIKGYSQTFQSVKSKAEKEVKQLAIQMAEVYKYRCEDYYLSCKIKSYNGCQGTSERQCFEDISKPQQCFDDGASLGIQPIIAAPNNQFQDQDIPFICTLGGVDEKMKEVAKYPHKWAYIANYNGLIKVYPGLKLPCDDYDPRYRPWYVAAATGRKNVIVFIDISSEMIPGSPSKISLAKDAAITAISTLGLADTVAVIAFREFAEVIGFDGIVRATQKNKAQIIDAISKLSATGIANYTRAFQKSFQLITQAKQANLLTCQNQTMNVFLYITHSSTNSDYTGAINQIQQNKEQTPVYLFTYGILSQSESSDANFNYNDNILKQLACDNTGISFFIKDGTKAKVVSVMRQYYVFLSHGAQIQEPIWTQPYVDAFIEEDVISVVYPIYFQDDQNNGIRILLGVASLDLTMTFLQDFGVTKDNAVSKFISTIPCQQNTLSQCQLQSLRKSQSSDAVCDNIQTTCQTSTIKPFCQDQTYPPKSDVILKAEDTSQDLCCGLTTKVVIIIIACSVGGFLLIVIIAGCCIWRRRKRSEQSSQEEQDQPHGSGQEISKKQQMQQSSSQIHEQPRYSLYKEELNGENNQYNPNQQQPAFNQMNSAPPGFGTMYVAPPMYMGPYPPMYGNQVFIDPNAYGDQNGYNGYNSMAPMPQYPPPPFGVHTISIPPPMAQQGYQPSYHQPSHHQDSQK